MLTQQRLRELLNYEPSTGVFTWVVNLRGRGGAVRAGKKAGSPDSKGKLQIKVDGTIYFAHRLAFLYMEGAMPINHVDHINRDFKDNRWANLRHATAKENMMNREWNRPIPRGVYISKYGTIRSAIWDGGKLRWLGIFSSEEEAHEAYMRELRKRPSFTHYIGRP